MKMANATQVGSFLGDGEDESDMLYFLLTACMAAMEIGDSEIDGREVECFDGGTWGAGILVRP